MKLPPAPSLPVTPAAWEAISRAAAQEKIQAPAFLIFVNGGGCAGFSYEFKMESAAQIDLSDFITTKGPGDALVCVDTLSWNYLQSAQLDHQDSIAASRFVLENPLATSQCGCGMSVSF